MELRNFDIPISGRTDFTIRHITDIHLGSEGHHKELFNRFLKLQENDKNAWWICTGDMIDADRPSMRDRKRLMYSDRPDALTQADEESQDWLDIHIVPKLKRIKDRCLGILDGDHYRLYSNGDTSGKYLCRKIGLPYLGERMAYVRIRFLCKNRGDFTTYTILARHGRGASSSPGGDVAALQKQNQQFIADLYLGGHTHKEHCVPVPLVYPNKEFTDLKQKVLWFVRGGSFLHGFVIGKQLYPEQEEYTPLCTGWAEIQLLLHRTRINNHNLVCEASSVRMIAA